MKTECKCPAPGIGKEYRCDDEQQTSFASHCHCKCHANPICQGIEDMEKQDREREEFYKAVNSLDTELKRAHDEALRTAISTF